MRANPAFVVYSSAIPKDNPEILAARSQGIPPLRRAEVLSALMTTQKAICVAGMHGKTTTTALLSFVLNELAVQPSYAIGGDPVQFAVPARYIIPEALSDDSQDRPLPWFVSEIDESDGGLEAFNPLDAILLKGHDEHLA